MKIFVVDEIRNLQDLRKKLAGSAAVIDSEGYRALGGRWPLPARGTVMIGTVERGLVVPPRADCYFSDYFGAAIRIMDSQGFEIMFVIGGENLRRVARGYGGITFAS